MSNSSQSILTKIANWLRKHPFVLLFGMFATFVGCVANCIVLFVFATGSQDLSDFISGSPRSIAEKYFNAIMGGNCDLAMSFMVPGGQYQDPECGLINFAMIEDIAVREEYVPLINADATVTLAGEIRVWSNGFGEEVIYQSVEIYLQKLNNRWYVVDMSYGFVDIPSTIDGK